MLALSTIVENEGDKTVNAKVKWRIVDRQGTTVATAETSEQSVEEDGSATFRATARLVHPELW
jgi:hypothetical protein